VKWRGCILLSPRTDVSEVGVRLPLLLLYSRIEPLQHKDSLTRRVLSIFSTPCFLPTFTRLYLIYIQIITSNLNLSPTSLGTWRHWKLGGRKKNQTVYLNLLPIREYQLPWLSTRFYELFFQGRIISKLPSLHHWALLNTCRLSPKS